MNTLTIGYKAKAFELRNLIFFFLIALGLNWFRATLVFFGILKNLGGFTDPISLIAALAGPSPVIAAFLLTAITEGKPGVSALWKRFWNRNLNLKWLIVTLLFIPALWLIANIASRMLDGRDYAFFDQPGMFFGAFAIGLGAGLSEEFGWRGYVLPRFQARWNALASSLILGVIWASWHTRFFTTVVLNSFFGGVQAQPGVWEWALWIVASSVYITWIFNNSNGSVLAAVLFHTMMNAGAVIFWCCGSSWLWPAVLVVAAILIVIIFGPKNLVRQRLEERRWVGLKVEG